MAEDYEHLFGSSTRRASVYRGSGSDELDRRRGLRGGEAETPGGAAGRGPRGELSGERPAGRELRDVGFRARRGGDVYFRVSQSTRSPCSWSTPEATARQRYRVRHGTRA